MNSSVVIRTPYVHSSTTYAALQLADTLRLMGVRVKMRAQGKRRQAVSWYWDSRTLWETGRPESSNMEVWFASPAKDLWKAVTQPNCRRVIVHVPNCSWDRYVYQQAMLVVCPNSFAVQRMEANRIGSALIAWDTPGEFVRRTTTNRPGQLFLSLSGEQGRYVDCDFMPELLRLLDELRQVRLVIAPPSIAQRRESRRCLRSVQRILGSRCQVLVRDDAFAQQAAIACSDLCLVPARCDTFGFGLASAHLSGTPAVAWDISPFRELSKTVTELLVGTPVDPDQGTQYACGAWSSMLRMTRDWLLQPDALRALQTPLQAAAERRRSNFVRFWQAVMEDLK